MRKALVLFALLFMVAFAAIAPPATAYAPPQHGISGRFFPAGHYLPRRPHRKLCKPRLRLCPAGHYCPSPIETGTPRPR